jgi:hypothetical protein
MALISATLMTWSDCNLAGDEWVWRVFVTRRGDGSYSVGARQVSESGEGGHRVRGSYRLRRGERILRALEDLFMHEVLQGEEPDWAAILRNARRFDPVLGRVLRRALNDRAGAMADEAIELARADW